ncbi:MULTISPECIES: DUF4148 domain-containing protein [unclassified Duganella]|uniref:DUF4148 domain-containing protein n=1 Tax=unclassified Duganella TaxID=2636909 RepID=UPI0006F293C3|nr:MULTISPECIES: DUF4148 domain-containing protein [unclassified Duganella]KQV59094.1 hypothetical protein ASD07_26040 [Duganella sp. Root336D2]KRB93382.1 hypothetical protein ASE26_27945 [Duganella sp. Root198D2]
MKAFATIIASAALALSTAAQAAPPDSNSGEGYQADTSFMSTKTRAEVKAETIAALQRGEILNGELYPLDFAAPTRGKTRAQVKAELALALRNGEIRIDQ